MAGDNDFKEFRKKTCPRLRDPASLLPLDAVLSSRKLGQLFYRDTVQCPIEFGLRFVDPFPRVLIRLRCKSRERNK